MSIAKTLRGGGGGGGSSTPRTPIEAPDSLRSNAYAKILDLVSEGEIYGFADQAKPLTCIFFNETPLENIDGSLNFKNVQVDSRVGTQTQDPIKGLQGVENETSVNSEMRVETPWVQTLSNTSLTALRIRLSTPAMSKADTSNGDISGYSVAYKIDLAVDGGSYANVFNGAFTGKTTSTYERSHLIDLPPATTNWTVRVSRITPNTESSAIQDSMYVVSYTQIVDVKLRMPMSAMVYTVIDAEQFRSIPTRSFRLKGRLVKVPSNYDPATKQYTGIWDGTFQIRYTNNPAWAFYDLALNDRYGLGHLIDESLVDKWALYTTSMYCDGWVPNGKPIRATGVTTGPIDISALAGTNRYGRATGSFLADGFLVGDGIKVSGFGSDENDGYAVITSVNDTQIYVSKPNDLITSASAAGRTIELTSPLERRFECNLYLQSQGDALRVMQNLATVFRGIVYASGGGITTVPDMPVDAIYTYTPANVIDGKFQYTGSGRKARHTVALVSWNNMADFGRAKIEYVDDKVGIARYGIQPVETIAIGCTSQGQARRLGKYTLATERYETDLISWSVGLDGVIAIPGKIVNVADPLRAGKRTGGRISIGSINSITVDQLPVGIANGDNITVSLPTGIAQVRAVSGIVGNVITVSPNFTAVPVAQSVWIVESDSLYAQKVRVISVTERKEGLGYDIAGLQHIEGKFDFVELGIAFDEPPVSGGSQLVFAPGYLTLDYHVRTDGYGLANVLTADWENVNGAVKYGIEWRKDSGNWTPPVIVNTSNATLDGVFQGTYVAKVWAIGADGRASTSSLSDPIVVPQAESAVKELDIIAGAVIIDCAYAQFRLVLNQNVTGATFINVTATDTILISIEQQSPGGFTCNFGPSVVPLNGIPYVPSAATGSKDVVGLNTVNSGLRWDMVYEKSAGNGDAFVASIAPSPASGTSNTDGVTGSAPSKAVTGSTTGGTAPITHGWTKASGPGTAFNISSASVANPTFTIPVGTTAYLTTQSWRYTATDSTGKVATALVDITLERTITGGLAVSASPNPAYGFCSATYDPINGRPLQCSPGVTMTVSTTGDTGTKTYSVSRIDGGGGTDFVVGSGTTATPRFSIARGMYSTNETQTWRCSVHDSGTGQDGYVDVVVNLERTEGL